MQLCGLLHKLSNAKVAFTGFSGTVQRSDDIYDRSN